MTTKERIIGQLDGLDEGQLAAIEEQIERFRPDREADKQARIARQLEEEFRLLDELAAPMSEADKIAFKEAIRGG